MLLHRVFLELSELILWFLSMILHKMLLMGWYPTAPDLVKVNFSMIWSTFLRSHERNLFFLALYSTVQYMPPMHMHSPSSIVSKVKVTGTRGQYFKQTGPRPCIPFLLSQKKKKGTKTDTRRPTPLGWCSVQNSECKSTFKLLHTIRVLYVRDVQVGCLTAEIDRSPPAATCKLRGGENSLFFLPRWAAYVAPRAILQA